jgi:hypothetical protein
MDIKNISPEGVVLKPFSSIQFTLLQSPAADLLPATVEFYATSSLGKRVQGIVDGVFQPNWEGVILPTGVGPHEYLTIIITTWPPEITSPEIWAFRAAVGCAV